jgi:hypothetical protein
MPPMRWIRLAASAKREQEQQRELHNSRAQALAEARDELRGPGRARRTRPGSGVARAEPAAAGLHVTKDPCPARRAAAAGGPKGASESNGS